MLRTRQFIFHDGRKARRFTISPAHQLFSAGVAVMTLCLTGYGAVQAANAGAPDAQVAAMEAEVTKMRADVAAVREAAKAHAARVEKRQALIAAVLSGTGEPEELAALAEASEARVQAAAAQILAPLQRVEARQVQFAMAAQQATDARIAATERQLKKLGMKPGRVLARAGMGGPYLPLDSKEGADAAIEVNADAQFRSLFQSWKKLDTLEQAVISIPSLQPVENVSLTSTFGIRSDPFRGTAAMHAGIDIPGPVGTPVYATADGIVSRAQRAGGYGNLVEINHGKGIQTRYGHLSKIVIGDNVRVKRGQLIGLMGSTGRSTGSHLHYEVRVGGRPVNPVPYMQTADVLLGAQDKALRQRAAVGGPAK
ncbi:M23 family metallopeptidase [Sphingomonas sp.]|uniref:M23 family metallopeptidase n=1 Tax=Sphingomonas sp. TaxID=28214 RepID=UPI002B72EFBD|nr:M23 family metallopeptidase [Sphingomonas sp.]HTG38990.1 M23 family metallopeptidase [Sphingomonas sp.]